tara:strand:- start:321 stop:554 length:234 start_codon:yes stop_codon:yes gene_type:complete
MTTLTYKTPVPRKDRKTNQYVYDIITLYNVEFVSKSDGNDYFCGKGAELGFYRGTTTKRGKKYGYCCPSKVIEIKTK